MPERVYIGNLSRDASRADLRDMFEPFGRILDLTVKNGFGFVEFNSRSDADEAVRECHGNKICGQRIVVEIAMKRRDHRREPRERESYRLIVKNIPPKTTWQDLKDMMKKAGRVTFADVLKDTDEGIVEFAHRDDMKYALSKYNNTKLNGQRVTLEEPGRRNRSRRDRSYSRSRSRSRSRSPRRRSRRRSTSRSVSNRRRSRSASPMSRSVSRSRSASRSPSRLPSRSPSRSVSPPRHSSSSRRDDSRSRSRSRSPRRSPSPEEENYDKDDK
ncbi:hypothetical protein BJ944DRAFT_281853 [Cunninghamella echinulata]|nr:hypothetical protein BJ944DRAFT_281853 [Cunninghamella echinulata]